MVSQSYRKYELTGIDSYGDWFINRNDRRDDYCHIPVSLREDALDLSLYRLGRYVEYMDSIGPDYRFVEPPACCTNVIAGYSMVIGEQLAKFIRCSGYRARTVPPFQKKRDTDKAMFRIELLIDLRNKIAHELSIGVSGSALYTTAKYQILSDEYIDAIYWLEDTVKSLCPAFFDIKTVPTRKQ